ncbi:MAG TPA: EI24 domain-containing protein [Macromonas sp.]|nr:EI24 domain-containing protein [Macromonas sp.]
MGVLIGSFWRALAYCFTPRVILLSLLPLLLMVGGTLALAFLYWDAAVANVMGWLEQWELVSFVLGWLDSVGLGGMRSMFAPLIVLALVTPVIVVGALLLVGLFMTPAMVDMVVRRRFPGLERKQGATTWASIGWSLWSGALAFIALLLSMPFWLVPPLALVVPPLIWGWLSYRVFAFDALADHASREERELLLRRHRHALVLMGIVSGYLGAAPSLVWASGALFISLAPILVPLAIWIYAFVFAFASLWFAHYLLEALHRLRQPSAAGPAAPLVDAVATERPPAVQELP